ncbi:MAG: hypothetical protein A2469_00065 [Candidatus Magasanikbacteria bacterium RIFOXYC2_FULL_40_16]|uniref:Uncharacterized protein n=3 Tax=Candidatus Magasanikiibacteriota TaxID=1752731 RepID=A0A1F6NHZ7_9BACT|nr:MAG: hypothetical protein A2224_02610 [Candidatus Magasanikbacteria bacterium RIFOXYA2_FULL_40_20]OGH83458.1 MAG: hypothetical protein A2373_03960 [Candidatus Magasanikbacteria bacterium RIFOXYB1_FULL_40_15]OGH86283.1 MAG: hypothetical protein A2301_03850 [Candidatus Magasanikbacteria bacterium RIFOXYB2_FULL_40_13]OGH87185.1 MAG: hypothetical protein A2206_03905 [Candidatus Magasanikbacteria bacterium RIFOXYA1_FULL_40_8]OGH89659.1 MAG: hypothetical protein A2469_00065 [Candidatus Magasanikba
MARKAQNIISVIPALLSSLALFVIYRYQSRLVFVIVLPVWLLLIVLFEIKVRKARNKEQSLLPIILITIFSFLSLISIVEWNFLKPFFVFLIGFVMLLLFQSLFSEDSFLQIEQKPYRRIMVVIWSFDAFAIITTIFALSLFFPKIPFWALNLIGGAVFAGISVMIWKKYFEIARKQWLIWAFLIGFLMIELIWVMHFLPFGYLVSGFFLTWLWYILQLLTRFHFGPNGVVWKRQILFLSVNLVIFAALLLFFVRWV